MVRQSYSDSRSSPLTLLEETTLTLAQPKTDDIEEEIKKIEAQVRPASDTEITIIDHRSFFLRGSI